MYAPGESPSELIDTAFDTCFAIEDAHLNPTSKQLAMDEFFSSSPATQASPRGALLLINHASACYICFVHVWHARNLLQAPAQHWPEQTGPAVLESLEVAVDGRLRRAAWRRGKAEGTGEEEEAEEEGKARCSTGPQRWPSRRARQRKGRGRGGRRQRGRYEDGGVDDVNASDLRKPSR